MRSTSESKSLAAPTFLSSVCPSPADFLQPLPLSLHLFLWLCHETCSGYKESKSNEPAGLGLPVSALMPVQTFWEPRMSDDRPPGASPCECCGSGTPGTAVINGLLQMAQLAHFKVWSHKGGSWGSVCLLVTEQNPFWWSSRTVSYTYVPPFLCLKDISFYFRYWSWDFANLI